MIMFPVLSKGKKQIENIFLKKYFQRKKMTEYKLIGKIYRYDLYFENQNYVELSFSQIGQPQNRFDIFEYKVLEA